MGDGVACVALADTVVMLWDKPAATARWIWFIEQATKASATAPKGVIILNIILPSSSPPDGELRGRMQKDLRAMGPALHKMVAVAMGDGMWTSVVRTLIRSILLLSGQSQKQAVVATVAEGLDHIRGIASPQTPSRPELQTAVDQLFAALKPQTIRAEG